MKLNIVSLGCDKNRVDTEKILYRLQGMEIVGDMADADVIIINTCAFILPAREEAIDTILQAIECKKRGSCRKLIVTGCLVSGYVNELTESLPEVDAFVGINDYDKIAQAVYGDEKVVFACSTPKIEPLKRVLSTPPHYAYLKIADGCDNKCTYCMIPKLRGKYRSVPMDDLLVEAQELVDNGVKELVIVAQDVTRYGIDIYGEYKLVELIRKLTKLDLWKVRLMYCYPELVTDELIEEIKTNDRVAKYIDLPLQHIDNDILAKMNRRSTEKEILALINKLKGAGIAIRTTLMTGFPTETDEQFSKLLNFVKEVKLRHVGVFAYSDEDAPSSKIKGKVPKYVRHNRAKMLLKAQKEVVKAYNEGMIGKIVKVVYEDIDYEKMLFRGRTEDCAPEVDTYVYFKADFADIGKLYDVKILKVKGYDLIGEVVHE